MIGRKGKRMRRGRRDQQGKQKLMQRERNKINNKNVQRERDIGRWVREEHIR